jgi:uncharacterized protein (TIGR00251 family)
MTDAVARLKVKVVPGSSKSVIAGWLEDTLKVRVTAPPEKGKANKAVEGLIADSLELSRSSVTVISGRTSPNKTIELKGITITQAQAKLEYPGTYFNHS